MAKKKGPQKYPPYTRFSPYFRKGGSQEVNKNDNSWNRAGLYIDDILFDFINKINFVVGHVRADGKPVVSLKIAGGQKDHNRAVSHGDKPTVLTFVNNEGDYKISRNHYFPKHNMMHIIDGTVVEVKRQVVDPSAKQHTVIIEHGANQLNAKDTFNPQTVTIKKDEVVRWESEEDDSSHTVFSGSHAYNGKTLGSVWMSPIIKPHGCFMRQFNETGTFDYSCVAHKWMKGKIIVV